MIYKVVCVLKPRDGLYLLAAETSEIDCLGLVWSLKSKLETGENKLKVEVKVSRVRKEGMGGDPSSEVTLGRSSHLRLTTALLRILASSMYQHISDASPHFHCAFLQIQ